MQLRVRGEEKESRALSFAPLSSHILLCKRYAMQTNRPRPVLSAAFRARFRVRLAQNQMLTTSAMHLRCSVIACSVATANTTITLFTCVPRAPFVR